MMKMLLTTIAVLIMIGVPKDVAGKPISLSRYMLQECLIGFTSLLWLSFLLIFSAIKYDIDSNQIPNDHFECTQ